MKRHRDDDGAVLIVVLIIVMIVSVVLSALLSLADSSLRTTVHLREQAATSADADGSVQAAINDIGNGPANATGPCFDDDNPSDGIHHSSNTLTLPSFGGDTSASVSCVAVPVGVPIHCRPGDCNRPGNAILTLGSIPSEDGLSISQPNTSTLRVHGSVYSHSTIDVASGALAASSGIYAQGACTGTMSSTPAPACSSSAAGPLGVDPGYLPAISNVPSPQPLPACTTKKSVVRFSPGYYDDAAALSDMMSGSGKSHCQGSTWWFSPGTYYFDFHNSGSNSNPLLAAADNVWTINDGTLVAGTPVNESGGQISEPAVPAAIPGACDNPIHNTKAAGVQFIFGGDSRLLVKAGQAEICGSYNEKKPMVAVYGLTAGTDATTANTLAVSDDAPMTGDFGTSATDLSAKNDGKVASWTSTRNNQDGTLTVGGFAPPAAIPAGSVLTSASVRVIHRHGLAGSGLDPLTVAVTPSGGTAQSVTLPGAPPATTFQTDQITLPLDTTTGHLAASIYAGTFTGAQISVKAALGTKGDTEFIDAVQLDLAYVPPALRAGTGCVIAGPYTGGSSSSCAIISTTNSPGNQFYVQGTTYTPEAAIDLNLNNVAEQIFRFGVIARALRIKQTGSFAYAGPVIEVPDDTPGSRYPIYHLSAFVCPAATTCPAGDTPALRAAVEFGDVASDGQRRITILSWAGTG